MPVANAEAGPQAAQCSPVTAVPVGSRGGRRRPDGTPRDGRDPQDGPASRRRRTGSAGKRRRPGAGGTLLALGRAPRLSALALATSLIPTTLAGHAYWTIEDPATRKLQRIQFHKNMAMIGGLLFTVLDQPQARP